MQLLPRDAIPAILAPAMIPAGEAVAQHRIRDEEMVLGLETGGGARAYSLWFLDLHEVVNDTIDGVPVAITWCPLCYSGIVYDRRVSGRVLTFGVSGALWRDALVLYDRETGSLWSHFRGQPLIGEFAGLTPRPQLTVMPSRVTTFKLWHALHPRTLVLKSDQPMNESRYQRYFDDPKRLGVLGRSLIDDRMAAKEIVIGLNSGSRQTVIPLKTLVAAGYLEFEHAGEPLLAAADPSGKGAAVFKRRLRSGAILHLVRRKGGLVDEKTGGRWDPWAGVALSGPLAGASLEPYPFIRSFWFAWAQFYPSSTIVSGGAESPPSTIRPD